MKYSKLDPQELQRYIRQILLNEVGEQGQLKLKNSSVLCVGAGGLGCPALQYLAAAGVGRIGIVDADTISLDNLHRQVLYATEDAGKLKTEKAKESLLKLNPSIEIKIFSEKLTAENAEKIFSDYDGVIDATDNFTTRYLINDAAIKFDKPVFFGSIFKFTGQVAVFTRGSGCYRCLFPQPPAPELAPDCSLAGVLGVLPGIIGSYQALEFLKWRLGIGNVLFGQILTVDVLTHQSRVLQFHRSEHCVACSHPEKIQLQSSAKVKHESSITPAQLKAALERKENIFLLDVREPAERKVGHIGGTLIPASEISATSIALPNNTDSRIIVYCRSGARSAQICEELREWGYSNVHNLEGGLLAWQQAIDPHLKI